MDVVRIIRRPSRQRLGRIRRNLAGLPPAAQLLTKSATGRWTQAQANHSMSSRPYLLSALIALLLSQASTASAKVARNWNDLAPGPRVVRYDLEKDVLVHQTSVTSGLNRRPGGDHSYSGNRLEAFHYRGKPGTGGIYDALDDYKNRLDPRNYRYRHR